MALRTENGWYAVEPDACEWVRIPGAEHVSIQVQRGQPSTLLRAYIADYHANIEPVRNNDTACYTRENSVHTSNHKSATATDINWDSHPFRVDYAGFDPDKIRRMRDMLAFYNFKGVQIIFWAQDWNSPKDAMHHQLGYNTYDNPVVAEFIRERIRPDGFSTYKRSGTPPAPPAPVSKQDQYALFVMAEGRRRGITSRGIEIAFSVVFVESNWKMYANSRVPESMAIPHDAVGSDHDSVGLFQQRCPMWGPAHVLMNPALSAGLFFDRLVKLDYNSDSHTPGFYAQAVQRSAFPDRYDQRFGDAAALYNRLAGAPPPQPQPTTGGFLMALSDQQQRELYEAVCGQRPSKSPLRRLGEGSIGNMRDVVMFVDGSEHVEIVTVMARLGHPASLKLLTEVANADLNAYPDRADDKAVAQAILADITAPPVDPQPATNERLSSAIPAVYEPEPRHAAPAEDAPRGLGDVVKTVVDAVEQLKLSDALSNQDYATLDASIKILKMKNGSES